MIVVSCHPLNSIYEIPTLEGVKSTLRGADLEKAVSGTSGTCGHFVGDHTILRQIGNTSLAAKGALAHCLQRRTAFKIQYG